MSKDNQKMTGDSVYRVKMYKDGKRWVYAGATTLALAAGLVFANVNASADTTGNNNTQTEQVESNASSANATSSASTSQAASGASSASSTSTVGSTGSNANSAAQSTATQPTTAQASAVQKTAAQPVAATAAAVQSRAASVDTTAKVTQETPKVTAPTSSATPKVNSEASLTTSEAASGSTSEATSTVATGSGYVAASHDVNPNDVKVDGTTVTQTKKGQTYDMQVVLTKNTAIDWTKGETNGQFVIAPAGSSETANGTWKAVSYQIDDKTPVSVTGSSITVDVKDVINANTLTFNYEYTATNDTNSNSDYLSINDIPNADSKANIDATPGANTTFQNGWTYEAKTTADVTTTTPAEDAQDVAVAYVLVTGTNADGTPKYTKIDGGVTKSGKVGTTFAVTPATIDGYAFIGAMGNVKGDKASLTGTVSATAEDNYVVLMYAENTGLVVNYQTADGSTVAASNQYTQGTDGTFTRAGGTYAVTAPSVDGYTYTGYKIGDGDVQTGDVANGTLVAGANTVTFIYAPIVEQSDITVNYVDEAGKTIKDPITLTGDNGTNYTVTTPEIDGYTYKSASDSLTGQYDGNKTITLTYTKNATPVEQSTVTVNYVDEDGNTIKAATSQTLDNGSTYTVETPAIDGYTYKSADAALTGTVDGNKTITLTYTKNATPVEQSTVTVNYVDEDGNTIKAATSQTLDNGSTYTVETPAIDGYTYKSADAALTGTVDGNKTITLTYTKDSTTPVENKANLTINYVDADGNTIKASSVTEYVVGQAYTVGQPEIAGYTYDHATGDAIAGTIAYNGNTVTLVYTKNGSTTPTEQTKTITVNYVDADGNTIKTATTTTYKVGDTYTVATPTIDGYTYKSADGDLSGTVADDATITLTYVKNDNGGTTTAPTTAPGTGDNINGGGTGTTTTAPTTAPVTTPSDDDVDDNNSSNGSTGTTTAPATTVSDDEVTPTTTATTSNGTSGVVPATAAASLKPVVTTKTTTSDAKTLPQTDEDENGTALAVLGLSTLLMGSALYFGVSRRKHEA
ncbi:MucBP domain-containing protein [Lactiplantibacillus pentosus]|nr:MucBP domain-containing protein [Lactiplantibacillus pentosus]MDO7805249.1 MucBP domain-containing protein [Lactiplantibacillus pentosus]